MIAFLKGYMNTSSMCAHNAMNTCTMCIFDYIFGMICQHTGLFKLKNTTFLNLKSKYVTANLVAVSFWFFGCVCLCVCGGGEGGNSHCVCVQIFANGSWSIKFTDTKA